MRQRSAPWRFRIYLFIKKRRGGSLRFALINVLLFFISAILVIGMDYAIGTELYHRWGLNLFLGFVTGVSSVAIFNVIVESMGLGYAEWEASE